MRGAYPRPPPSRSSGAGQSGALSRQLNTQITQAASLQDLTHVVLVNFGRMNAVNHCTAYHRIAKHVQDERTLPEAWPHAIQQQLGSLLTQLNQALVDRLQEVQAHNLGLTLWSISKTHRLPQLHCDELSAALQEEIVRRLATVSQSTYMTDKFYNFGPQSLSNIIYSAAAMGLKPNYDLLHAVARAVAWQVEEFKPQGLANILWGLGKLGVKVTHEVRAMVEALGREMTAQLTHSRHKGSFAPQNVSNTLHGIVNIGIVPAPELLSALVQCTDSMLRQFGPQELTNLVWSLSQMHRAGVPFTNDVDALLSRIPDELGLLFGDRAWRARVKPQTISNLSLAYAHLGRKPQLLMTTLVKEAVTLLPQFKPQELSNLLWSMASMDFWPGSGVVESIARAAGAVADRMKPQELANSCWAWATMRFFPGAAVLDGMLMHAEAQLERFKSQELGMMCWAMARLAYMPAATLVRAALPLAAEWRSPAVQDCGNLLWAFTVLGILTPDAMALLADKLLALPQEQFTQEAYIQLYQAKMTLSQQVYDIATYIPPELLARGETEWRKQTEVLKVSVTHRDVASVMTALGIDHDIERRIEDGLMSVDIALKSELVAVEVDGSAHFTQNEPFVPLGRTLWRWRLLGSRGWKIVSVPYFRWGLLRSLDEKKRYLYQLLQCESVWECYGLDPQDRDAPPILPVNLAHLTPEEVFRYAAQGMPCSSLLQQANSTTPVPSPSTPLLGLSPAISGAISGTMSSSFVPSLRPASSSSTGSGTLLRSSMALQLPLPMGAGMGAAAGNGNGYSRLPDNLFGSDSPQGSGSFGGAASSGRQGSGLNIAARPFTFSGGSGMFGGTSNRRTLGGASTPATASPVLPVPHDSPALPLAADASIGSSRLGDISAASFASPLQFGSRYSPPVPQLQVLPMQQAKQPMQAPLRSSPRAAARLSPAPSTEPTAVPASLPGLGVDSDEDISDLRSYFASVIGMSLAESQQPQGPLSVEEVRRKLALLPAEQAVADVAAEWLADWDAALVVELLGQLDSPTTAARAVQLFDWLRSLASDSPQASLCTPATYVAMIGLYGRWRKPKPAVRLFAELKEWGDDMPEVHSALVEAFCRSGQYEVAVDAYRNMQDQGLAPTPAALCTLLDHHMQHGSWEEADTVLAGCVKQGGANREIFDAVIEQACAAGNTAAAQSAFGHMCAAGAAPSPATFTCLLTALRRQHTTEAVAELTVGLVNQADAAPGSVHGQATLALLEACATNGWSDVSLQLLAAVEQVNGSPSLELINGVLAACAAAGAVHEARQAFDKLPCFRLQPSPESYLHLVQALCGAGRWAQAAEVYESMLATGLEPPEELASLAVDALWCMGLARAQAKALELFDQAASAGWLPPLATSLSHGGLLKLDLQALHVGTGMLRMHRWLVDLRASIGNSGTPCVLDQAKRLCVISGARDGGSHASNKLAADLKDALGASLVLHRAPFRVLHEAGRAQRMETSPFMLKKWLFTESFDQWDQAFRGAAALVQVQGGSETAERHRRQEAQLEEVGSQTYELIREYEAGHALDAAALRLSCYHHRRRELVGGVQQLALGLGDDTAQVWHAAVILLDRCTSAGYQTRMDALLAAACVFLAAQEVGAPVTTGQLAGLLDGKATLQVVGAQPKAALASELQLVTSALQGDTACLSAMHCWKVFANRLECNVESTEQMEVLLGDSFSRLHQLASEDIYTTYSPSILAAAAVYLGRKQRGVVPFWPSVLQQLTGYHEGLHPEFSAALRELQNASQYGSTISQAVFS